jgi:hypothetical protein
VAQRLLYLNVMLENFTFITSLDKDVTGCDMSVYPLYLRGGSFASFTASLLVLLTFPLWGHMCCGY